MISSKIKLPDDLYTTTGDIKNFGKYSTQQLIDFYNAGLDAAASIILEEKAAVIKTAYQEQYNAGVEATASRILGMKYV
jgi:hypothetical protein